MLEDYDEVYIDTLLPSSYGGVRGLLNEGKNVYLLREPKLVKKMRRQNNLRIKGNTLPVSANSG